MMFRIKSLSLVVVSIAVLAGCQDNDSLTFTNVIDARTFVLNTPPSWTLDEAVGYDSYVGEIRGPMGVIYFDQGFFSFPGLDNIAENERTIYLRHITINGLPAILRKETLAGTDRRIQLSLFIEGENPGQLNHLYFFNPDAVSEQVVIGIMKTHRFKL